jgi:hypothetical protein
LKAINIKTTPPSNSTLLSNQDPQLAPITIPNQLKANVVKVIIKQAYIGLTASIVREKPAAIASMLVANAHIIITLWVILTIPSLLDLYIIFAPTKTSTHLPAA